MVRLELSALPVVVQTIAQITALLAEQGYTVCAIREEARRNEHDKRAFLGSDMARLLLIQATAKGSVSITSFLHKGAYRPLHERLTKRDAFPARVIWVERPTRFKEADAAWVKRHFSDIPTEPAPERIIRAQKR